MLLSIIIIAALGMIFSIISHDYSKDTIVIVLLASIVAIACWEICFIVSIIAICVAVVMILLEML